MQAFVSYNCPSSTCRSVGNTACESPLTSTMKEHQPPLGQAFKYGELFRPTADPLNNLLYRTIADMQKEVNTPASSGILGNRHNLSVSAVMAGSLGYAASTSKARRLAHRTVSKRTPRRDQVYSSAPFSRFAARCSAIVSINCTSSSSAYGIHLAVCIGRLRPSKCGANR